MTGLLLDTHIFLWYASNDSKLPSPIRQQIENEPSPVYLSGVSVWEISIKCGLGKLELPQPLTDLFDLANQGIRLLEPTVTDYLAYSRLPFPLTNHRDPFGRMLVVQAVEQDLLLITSDQVFQSYLPLERLLVP